MQKDAVISTHLLLCKDKNLISFTNIFQVPSQIPKTMNKLNKNNLLGEIPFFRRWVLINLLLFTLNWIDSVPTLFKGPTVYSSSLLAQPMG